MFVGVGAARVRDLFEQAKRARSLHRLHRRARRDRQDRAPACGVIADTTSASRRSTSCSSRWTASTAGKGVVILMAATNRPEVLDQALLRAGRFDRQVLVDRPGRARARGDPAGARRSEAPDREDVDLRVVAQRTPGMVGRRSRQRRERGRARRRPPRRDAGRAARLRGGDRPHPARPARRSGRVMTTRRSARGSRTTRAATRWSALSVKHADPVHRVTIIPRSIGALGATLQLPTEERYLMTREELRDRICVMLGGRAPRRSSSARSRRARRTISSARPRRRARWCAASA